MSTSNKEIEKVVDELYMSKADRIEMGVLPIENLSPGVEKCERGRTFAIRMMGLEKERPPRDRRRAQERSNRGANQGTTRLT